MDAVRIGSGQGVCSRRVRRIGGLRSSEGCEMGCGMCGKQDCAGKGHVLRGLRGSRGGGEGKGSSANSATLSTLEKALAKMETMLGICSRRWCGGW